MLFKRIISLFLVLSISLSLCIVNCSALSLDELRTDISSFWDWYDFTVDSLERLDGYLDSSGFYDGLDRSTALYCSVADSETDGRYPYHYFEGGFTAASQSCKYCGISRTTYLEQLQNNYSNYVSSNNLDNTSYSYGSGSDDLFGNNTTVSSPAYNFKYTGYSSLSGSRAAYYNLADFSADSVSYYQKIFQGLGVNKYVAITSCDADYLHGFYFDECGVLCFGTFVNSLGSASVDCCGVFSLSALNKVSSYYLGSEYPGAVLNSTFYTAKIYYSKSYAEASPDFASSNCLAICFDSSYYVDAGQTSPGFYYYSKFASKSTWSSTVYNKRITLYPLLRNESTTRVEFPRGLLIDSNSRVHLIDNSAPGNSSSRPAALTQAQQDYNDLGFDTQYYIGDVDSSGNVTNVYAPNIINEQKLTFTEPTTGKQYLCTDWVYTYSNETGIGAYGLLLASDSYFIDSSEIIFIIVWYLEDGVLIHYFTSDDRDSINSDVEEAKSNGSYNDTTLYSIFTNNASYSSFYHYVIASAASVECEHEYTVETLVEATCIRDGQKRYTCSLCGKEVTFEVPRTEHVFDYETVSVATCVSYGVRKYTCTVCGSTYAEETSPTGLHSYQYSIYQEPSCEEVGIGLYTCSGCGDEYTEEIAASGHRYALVQYFPSEYDDEGNLVVAAYSLYRCAVCGNEYTETDNGASAENDGLLSWLASLFRSLISALVNGLSSGLEYLVNQVIVTITDLILQVIRWFMGLLDISSISQWFTWFSDDNQYFQNDFGIDSEVDVWAYSLE